MRTRQSLLVASLASLALAGCNARPAQEGSDNGNPTTGAHTVHLEGVGARPISCGECHNSRFEVTLEGHLARANDAVGAFSTTALTCSGVYCHSGGPSLPIGGGTTMTPKWNPPSKFGCDGCHAAPGGSAATPWHPVMAPGVQCELCHPGYTNTSVNRAVHVNGVADLYPPTLDTSCAACHGSATRPGSALIQAAPPTDRFGASDTRLASVGAHQAHLVPPPGAISPPIACAECHPVPPTDPADPRRLTHVGPTRTSPAKLAWGTIATSNDAVASYDRATATCTNYCHGQTLSAVGAAGTLTTPVWTKVDGTQAACGTCHASPPGDQVHYLHASPEAVGLTCEKCHPTGYTVGAVGTAAVSFHVNGRLDMNLTNLVPNFSDWNAAAANANGWTGTATGCHDRGRYWRPGRAGTTCW